MNTLRRLFTEHPSSLGETYSEHRAVALSYAVPLTRAAAAAYVHAFLPFLCVTTASRTVKALYDRMTRRCATCPAGPAHRPDLFRPNPARPAAVPSAGRRETMLAWDPVI